MQEFAIQNQTYKIDSDEYVRSEKEIARAKRLLAL
jgi:hypothetical protein